MSAQQARVTIREYDSGDHDAVMALAPRLTVWVAPWRDPADVLRAVLGWVSGSADQAGQEGHAFFVAVADGRVVGLVTVGEQAHFAGQVDGYVGELVVARDWEGRGVGRRLMAAAEDWAAGRGLAFLTLDTGADNHPARGLYRSLGFSEEKVGLTKRVTAGR